MPQVNEGKMRGGVSGGTRRQQDAMTPSPAMRRVRERVARLPHLAHMSHMVTLAQLAASIAHEVNPTITASVVDGKEMKLRNLRAPAVVVPALFEDGGVAVQLTEQTATIGGVPAEQPAIGRRRWWTPVGLLVGCRGRHW
jgi:hypothetical protein